MKEEETREEQAAVFLRDIRRGAGMQQDELARMIGVSRGWVAVVEARDPYNRVVHTLHRYLDGMGAELELWAVMPDGQRIQLKLTS